MKKGVGEGVRGRRMFFFKLLYLSIVNFLVYLRESHCKAFVKQLKGQSHYKFIDHKMRETSITLDAYAQINFSYFNFQCIFLFLLFASNASSALK